MDRQEIIAAFLIQIKQANKEFTKKEHFKDLLHRLFPKTNEVQNIIDSISAGSEATILNIPRNNKIRRGSADTMFNKVIIEFENDLSKTYKHAKEQLAGYLLGQFNSGEGYNYTLIASDFIHWKVVAPKLEDVEKLEILNEEELELQEDVDASFTLTEHNADDFYFWLDRFLFKEEEQKATLKRIETTFGHNSNTFIECFRQIKMVFDDAKKFGEVQVSYEQWNKFLSIAYGSFDASTDTFVIHTYLSVFSKILAYGILSNDDFIDDEEMEGILNGNIFYRYNLKEFVDNDFFHWVHRPRYFVKLKKVFRLITQEVSNFNFNDVDEDVLKGVYQELIDIDTRHALGEYYTPDWLCERILSELPIKPFQKILDPSCGSGSFLRASIKTIKTNHPQLEASEINQMIYGIDIHPLSVQIAKTTVLISLGKSVAKSKTPIRINVILANTLLAPEGVETLFGGEFKLNIDRDDYVVNTQILNDVNLFDEALQVCDDLAARSKNEVNINRKVFETILQRQTKFIGTNKVVIDGFYTIYKGLKKVKENNRDSIWKFIIQNLYKPYFLNKTFDFVIGNPPWFTFSSIKNEEYQNVLNALAEKYSVKPERTANFPHLEIAAIFLAYCSQYFLKEGGQIMFVLPRSFMSADHHENTRAGMAKGFQITQIWDLDKVSPLFRVPSCVIIAQKADEKTKRSLPSKGVKGLSFEGRLKEHNCNYETASKRLDENRVKWYYSKHGKSSAFANQKRNSKKINPYKKEFKQGATIVPRAFYFIALNQQMPPDFEDRILNIKTADDIQINAKKPWKGITLKNRIESQFIFKTALSNNIVPFALINTCLVALPIIIENDEQFGGRAMKLYSADDLLQQGFLESSRWFANVERIWDIHKTERNAKMTAYDYINWQNKLLSQHLDKPYLVLYNASAKDANATVVVREEIDLEFIVESKAYVFYTNNKTEAYYLTAILNSSIPNLIIKDFQTRGLFGARDIHKKILDVYFPKFDDKKSLHTELAELSKTAHEKAKIYFKTTPPPKNPSPYELGRIRLDIKVHLEQELLKIDELVEKVLK